MAEFDKLAAARASNRDVPIAKTVAKQNCSDVVNISVYFDGTGNNKDEDRKLKRWANPARLWRAAELRLDKERPDYAIYVSGVGTKFNGTATDWMDNIRMNVQDHVTGEAAGGGGTRRTEMAQMNVSDGLRTALLQNAAKLNIPLKAYRETGKPVNISGLAAAIEAHGLITIINISIFGFSRGAALARAFSNDMLKACVTGKDGVLRYNGVPIRLHFMGLFDTVASFGLPSLNIGTPFDEKNLVVPQAVERCVHYVAAHELRFSFPVDLIRKNGVLKAGWTETVYPGVHSDVGGGYEKENQKVSNNYARIPMRDMMREAVKSGVRLLDYDDIQKFFYSAFEEAYEIKAEVEASYKQYMIAVGAPTTTEQAVTAHMKALYSAWGTLTHRKIKTPDMVEFDGRSALAIGHIGIAQEAAILLDQVGTPEYRKAHPSADVTSKIMQVQGMNYRMFVRPEKWRLDAWQTAASDAVVNFIKSSVHDSKAGFMGSIEPFSYFRPRGMAESSRNVLAAGMDWLDDAFTAVKNGVIKVFHRAQGVVVETWEDGKLVASHTYKVGEKFVVETVRAGVKYTVEVVQSGTQVVISAIVRGGQMIVTSVDMVKKQAGAAFDATSKKAGEVVDTVQDMAVKAGQNIHSGASQAVDYVGDAVDAQKKSIEDGWRAFRRERLGY